LTRRADGAVVPHLERALAVDGLHELIFAHKFLGPVSGAAEQRLNIAHGLHLAAERPDVSRGKADNG